jgi:hypothetical protein
MGIGPEHLTGAYAGWLASEGWLKRGDGMLDMGAQELFCAAKPESVNDFVTRFGGQPYPPAELARIADRGLAGEAMIRAGFRYASVDIKPYPFGIQLDLNRDQLPAEHHGRYQLVTNHGTSEHILNQWLFFQAMHDGAAEGALMYHSVPFCGEHEHGIVQYTPKFFWSLGEANDYKLVYPLCIAVADGARPLPPDFLKSLDVLPLERADALTVPSAWLVVVLRKTKMQPFAGLIDPAFR